MEKTVITCDICSIDLYKSSFCGGSMYMKYKVLPRIFNWHGDDKLSGNYIVCSDCLDRVKELIKENKKI